LLNASASVKPGRSGELELDSAGWELVRSRLVRDSADLHLQVLAGDRTLPWWFMVSAVEGAPEPQCDRNV
jgi:hypothetical protein